MTTSAQTLQPRQFFAGKADSHPTEGTIPQRAVKEAVERHHLKSVIDSRFALADVHQALSRLESRRQFGKVAVEVG